MLLPVGITFAFLRTNLMMAVSLIGCITFFLSFVGVVLGSFLGSRLRGHAERIGGIVLIVMGIKILIEHTTLWRG